MHVIIGGCGRVGAELAAQLAEAGEDVVVLDTDRTAFDRIPATFDGDTVVGDITDRSSLERAGVASADAVVAVTDLDNANLMGVELARALYGVPTTVARLFSPGREPSYQRMGVTYVSGTGLVAKAIAYQLSRGRFPQHVRFADDDVQVVEMRVRRAGHGATIAELEETGHLRVAALRRGARVRLPRLDERLQEGDLLVGAVRAGRLPNQVRELVAPPLSDEE